MKFRFIHLISFLGHNAWVFQRVSMNLNTTVCQAACRILCRKLAAFCVSLIVPIVTCESGERTYGCSCLKWTWSKVNVAPQIKAICRASSIVLQLNYSCFLWEILSFVSVSIT